MEVKMQYLVDLEDVPKECQELLDRINLSQWDFLPDACRLISEGEIMNSVRELESLRKELYRVDRRVADVSHILKGYLQAKIAQTKPNISAEADTAEDEEEQGLRELTEMIKSGLQTQIKETK